GHVADIIRDVFDIETLTIRSSASAQIQRVYGVALADELFGRPDVLTAMRVDAMADHDDRSRRWTGMPRAVEDFYFLRAFKSLLDDRDSGSLVHLAPRNGENFRCLARPYSSRACGDVNPARTRFYICGSHPFSQGAGQNPGVA